jgi:HPt (histidine-containing phosphotransfer) domain-containing protein
MATILEGLQPVDRKKLLAECDDEQSFANRCLHVFARDVQVDIDRIASALEKRDFPQIARLAHRIKGASASIRAEFLGQQAARLEELGSRKELTEAAECFSRLKTEFEQFKQFVSTLPLLPE